MSLSGVAGAPLDKKEIIVGSSKKPALHPDWVSSRGFVAYVAPPLDSSDQGQMGEWLERLQYISTDLHWLLQLSHQHFWCQVIFDESLHSCLDSFLRYAPRPYDEVLELTGNSSSLHDQVTRLIFFTYLRMATYKESKENWLTPAVFGDILYQNFLFDIPKLMDLCALYGHSNGALLGKMVSNVFSNQPQYLDDLRATVPIVLQVFVNIAIKCGLETESLDLAPQKLTDGKPSSSSSSVDLVSMAMGDFQDVVLYLADTALTLTSFLRIYPPACAVLHELHFCSQLAHMYEKLIPALQSSMRQRQFDSVRQKMMLRNKLQQARLHLLTTFHLIVSHTCLQPVLDSISEDTSKNSQYIEEFLGVMSAVLGEKRFLADYEGQFSFQDDMDILSQAADVDEAHYRYISEAINAAFTAHGRRKKPTGNMNTGGRTSPDGSPCPASALSSTAAAAAAAETMTLSTFAPQSSSAAVAPLHAIGAASESSVADRVRGAEAPVVTGVELDSLICAVKDLLPHLGSGFIQMALEALGYNVETVVSAILEDNLPESLRSVDFALDSVGRPVPEEALSEQALLVETRRNIYDNDEFDVFNNPAVDVNRIQKGKKTVEETKVLDDKKSVKELKSLYDAYGSMDVASMYDPQVYDDEYDDTYDTNNVGAEDADSADELTHRRPFTVPQVLRRPQKKTVESDSSSSEEDTAARDQFVQDPAKLREQREQRQQATAARNRRPPPPQRDVKGRAKGQGQTEEVLRNRRFKEMNKGARANHNRRAMSDKKHSKGMF
ncbi:activating signal cointegrator 1 complex subunit 2-like isoform X2 [Babylonia areolata]|uniref:activating signal cointegrator 1 complex subunit 2-like isoform X2 n=1 Tax=Babylonia areolata TaxID=304850 RepID=UPI003FD25914